MIPLMAKINVALRKQICQKFGSERVNTYFLKNGKLPIQKKLVISNIVVTKKVRYAVGATCMR